MFEFVEFCFGISMLLLSFGGLIALVGYGVNKSEEYDYKKAAK